MLHMNNRKEAAAASVAISIITTTTIEQKSREGENFIDGNKGIMSLTRRPILEKQSNLMSKNRAKNDEHHILTATTTTANNNYSSGSCGSATGSGSGSGSGNGTGSSSLTTSISKRKNANNKMQKSPKESMEQQATLEEQQKQKLHNNQPLIVNIEHLSCQTHALAHTTSNTRANLTAYSQPYSSMHNHTTNTLSTFKGKNSNSSSSALSRNSHYFSSLDNRSQRHHQHQHQHQQPNYQQIYRQKKRKQTYDSLLPYSVANLPILQKTNATTYGSSDDSSNEEGPTVMPHTPINKSGTTHCQQQHQHASKINQGHYMSPIQAKSSFQQQQQQVEITSFKQNKRHKLQHKQERST